MDFQTETPFRFLDLPGELRNRIYDLYFFGGEDDVPLQHVYFNRSPPRLGLETCDKGPGKAITAHRQIHPYRDSIYRDDRHLDLSIFQTSRQIQAEAEPVFYGLASFNLMGPWSDEHFQSFEFLQRLPQRYRKLIKNVEHYYCFVHCVPEHNSTLTIIYDFFGWRFFLNFLAQECPNLQSLKLWVWTRGFQAQELRSLTRSFACVRRILRLAHRTNLRHFDMPAIKSIPTEYPDKQTPSGGGSLLPCLQKHLLQVRHQNSRLSALPALHNPHDRPPSSAPFPFLKLPSSVRALVYCHALLPPNKQLLPFIKSWLNTSSRNVVPLLSVCHFIRHEAEDVLYREAVFTVPGGTRSYACELRRFFETIGPRLRAKVRYVNIVSSITLKSPERLVQYLAENMDLTELTYAVPEREVPKVNLFWLREGHKMFDGNWRRWLGLFKNINVKTFGEIELEPELRRWLEHGLREKQIARQRRLDTLRIRPRAAIS